MQVNSLPTYQHGVNYQNFISLTGLHYKVNEETGKTRLAIHV